MTGSGTPRLGLRGTSFGWYPYLSPNCTPWAATFLVGSRTDIGRRDRRMIAVRRALWGHGYDSERLDPQILDRAILAVEGRDSAAAAQLGRIIDERASWVA